MNRTTRSTIAAAVAVLATSVPVVTQTTDEHGWLGTGTLETPLGNFEFRGGYPTPEAVEDLTQALKLNRAIEAYLDQMPAVSWYNVWKGVAAAGPAAPNQLVIWESLMDSETLLLTGNTETVYGLAAIDLQRDGPVVVEVPPALLGGISDIWQAEIAGIGPTGVDRGQGGKILLLPPGYKGEVPAGYIVAPSTTYDVVLGVRGFLVDGKPEKAVELMKTAAMARAQSFASTDPARLVYPDRNWEWAFVGGSASWDSQGYVNTDRRAGFAYEAIGMSPAMVEKVVGQGSQYLIATRDASGAMLEGGKTYQLHLPADIPVKNFWSVVVYDASSRSMLRNGARFPSVSQFTGPEVNADGSIDVWFGPEAPAGKEKNWITTVPRKGWFPLVRFYGPLEPFFDASWKPDDIVSVDR